MLKIKEKLTDISVLLKVLIFLNLVDGLVTYYGLKNGLYVELNKMLQGLYEYSVVSYLSVKILIPAFMLVMLLIVIEQGKNKAKIVKGVKYFILLAIVMYMLLLMYHITLYGLYFLI